MKNRFYSISVCKEDKALPYPVSRTAITTTKATNRYETLSTTNIDKSRVFMVISD